MKTAKKKHPRFNVPNFGAKHRSRVPDRWRKQRGIDNKKREARQGYGATPVIGYKNSDSVRFARQNGKKEMLVHNEREIMQVQKDTVARIAHDVSKRKRLAMQRVADMQGIEIANRVIA